MFGAELIVAALIDVAMVVAFTFKVASSLTRHDHVRHSLSDVFACSLRFSSFTRPSPILFCRPANASLNPGSLYLESKPSHTFTILLDHILAIFLWIIGSTEQHTVISGNLLILANTAWFGLFGLRWLQICCEIVRWRWL